MVLTFQKDVGNWEKAFMSAVLYGEPILGHGISLKRMGLQKIMESLNSSWMKYN